MTEQEAMEYLQSRPVCGVRYNVIRRPLSGGKGTIVRHKPTKSNPDGESKEAYYARLGGIIEADPGYYFMRWKIEITQADVARFQRECLDPILEQLCFWYDTEIGEISADETVEKSGVPPAHYRTPFGIYNPLIEGGETDLDAYLQSGSEVGLRRVDDLFPELE